VNSLGAATPGLLSALGAGRTGTIDSLRNMASNRTGP
jgi:hypothetical protein